MHNEHSNFIRIEGNELTGNVATVDFDIDMTGCVDEDNELHGFTLYAKSPHGRKVECGVLYQQYRRLYMSLNTGFRRWHAWAVHDDRQGLDNYIRDGLYTVTPDDPANDEEKFCHGSQPNSASFTRIGNSKISVGAAIAAALKRAEAKSESDQRTRLKISCDETGLTFEASISAQNLAESRAQAGLGKRSIPLDELDARAGEIVSLANDAVEEVTRAVQSVPPPGMEEELSNFIGRVLKHCATLPDDIKAEFDTEYDEAQTLLEETYDAIKALNKALERAGLGEL
jgi:hypothetical protein